MAELADGTGGTYFHNNNELESGLKDLANGPEYRYLLEISLQDVKPNGAYHALKVEVDRRDVKLQARHGYFAPSAANSRK
jgi:VWFA-related protein